VSGQFFQLLFLAFPIILAFGTSSQCNGFATYGNSTPTTVKIGIVP
jgi:hypothetical protein